jgi:Tfp pilus assembly protein PilF
MSIPLPESAPAAAAPRKRPRRVLAVVGLLLLAVSAGLLGVGASAWYRLRLVGPALQALDFDRAQRHLDWSLTVWPWDGATRLLAAQVARRRGDLEGAKRRLDVCELGGMTPATALERAMLRAQQGELADVEQALEERYQQGGPEADLILEALARGSLAVEKWEEVVRWADALVQRRPDYYPALLWRGRGWEGMKQTANARADYEQLFARHPEVDEARLRLADLLQRLGWPTEAAGHFEAVQARQPENADVLLGLARCRYDLHDRAEAERLLDRLLALWPGHVAGLTERGRLALHGGRAAEAEHWLCRAVEAAPKDRDANHLLAVCLRNQGRAAEAEPYLARVRQLESDVARAEWLAERVRQAPNDAALRCEIGMLLLRAGRDVQGVGWLRTALEADPGHAASRLALAEYQRRTGKR